MSHGKVKTYYLTEEERLDYIKRHPIIATDSSPLATVRVAKFNPDYSIRSQESRAKSQTRITDGIDKEDLHKRFMSGDRLEDIAKAMNISTVTLNRFIRKQREIEPEKWPRRVVRKTPDRKTKWE